MRTPNNPSHDSMSIVTEKRGQCQEDSDPDASMFACSGEFPQPRTKKSPQPHQLRKQNPKNTPQPGTTIKTSQRTRCRRHQTNNIAIRQVLRPFAAVCGRSHFYSCCKRRIKTKHTDKNRLGQKRSSHKIPGSVQPRHLALGLSNDRTWREVSRLVEPSISAIPLPRERDSLGLTVLWH